MTKKYDIISLNNHLYMVDKEANIPKMGWFYNYESKAVGKNNNVAMFIDGGAIDTSWLILASTDTTLGLPLLPKVEEDIEILAEKAFKKRGLEGLSKMDKILWMGGWEYGYKAASVKKYTEKDLETAINTAYGHGKHSKLDIGDVRNRIIAVLTPKPIAVEVEMEEYEIPCPDGIEGCEVLHLAQKPKTKDNIVVIRRWIYE